MVQRVGVIGAGQMGGGIAEVAAKSGSDVLVWEAKQEALDFGKAKIEKSLSKAVERGKLSEEDRDAALGRLTFTTSLEDFADRELVMEAIIENEEIKKDVFSKLDAIVTDKGAPLCSNTSSLPIQAIASATENLRQNREFYRAGTSSLTELLDAETLYTQSRDKLTEARASYRTAVARYLRVTGR